MNRYLPAAIARARATQSAVLRDFGRLSPAQLNWKPAPDRWSVAQCLDHLRITNESYWPIFDAVAEGRKRDRWLERVPGLPRILGPLLRWATAPDTRARSRTRSRFEPSASDLPASVVEAFVQNVDAHLAKIEAAADVDHRRVVVTSPFAEVIVYTLEDAVLVSIAHLERHRLQALRVTRMPEFPGAGEEGAS